IFMVAAPLATVDINVDLPQSAASQQPRPDKPLYVTVEQDLTVSVGDEQVAHVDLRSALDRFTQGERETRVFLRADRRVSYGDLMNVMNRMRMGGYTQIALVGLETVAEAAPNTGDAAGDAAGP